MTAKLTRPDKPGWWWAWTGTNWCVIEVTDRDLDDLDDGASVARYALWTLCLPPEPPVMPSTTAP